VVEDAACAIGSEISPAPGKWEPIGRPWGDLATFSFHPRKVITTGEGGMILTDEDACAERARIRRAHGRSVSDLARHQARRGERGPDLGSLQMTDQAAIGIEQMKAGPALASVMSSHLVQQALGTSPVFNSSSSEILTTSVHDELSPNVPRTRDEVMARLLEAGIATRPGVMAIHITAYYRTHFPCVKLPVTERVTRNSLILPMYATMTDPEQAYVLEHLLPLL
jgi:perosamine synthetase